MLKGLRSLSYLYGVEGTEGVRERSVGLLLLQQVPQLARLCRSAVHQYDTRGKPWGNQDLACWGAMYGDQKK